MMERKKIKSLVVGLGKVGMLYDLYGDFYKSHSSSIFRNNNFELVGGVDTKKKNRMKFVKKYNKPAYAYFKNAINFIKPELIVVAVPTHNSDRIYKKIIKYNLIFKMIIFEKPVSYNLDIIKKIFSYCVKNNIKIAVNYLRRYDPSSNKIKSIIDSRKLGSFKKAYVYYKKGLFNSCSHYINFFEFMFGSQLSVLNAKFIGKNSHDFKIDFILITNNNFKIFFKFIKKNSSNERIQIFFEKGKIDYFTEKGRLSFKFNKNINYIKNNYGFPFENVYENISHVFFNKKTFARSSIKDALFTSILLKRILLKTKKINYV